MTLFNIAIHESDAKESLQSVLTGTLGAGEKGRDRNGGWKNSVKYEQGGSSKHYDSHLHFKVVKLTLIIFGLHLQRFYSSLSVSFYHYISCIFD